MHRLSLHQQDPLSLEEKKFICAYTLPFGKYNLACVFLAFCGCSYTYVKPVLGENLRLQGFIVFLLIDFWGLFFYGRFNVLGEIWLCVYYNIYFYHLNILIKGYCEFSFKKWAKLGLVLYNCTIISYFLVFLKHLCKFVFMCCNFAYLIDTVALWHWLIKIL